MKDEFHEFLREYTDVLTKIIIDTKRHTCNDLKRLIKNKNLLVLLGDKGSCVIIMNKQDCIQKLEDMLHDDIQRGTHERSPDTTKQDLETFQGFLYLNFKNHTSYDKMRPKFNQPARLYGTGKTYKFNDLDEIKVDKTYDTKKVIGEYLKPLAFN